MKIRKPPILIGSVLILVVLQIVVIPATGSGVMQTGPPDIDVTPPRQLKSLCHKEVLPRRT